MRHFIKIPFINKNIAFIDLPSIFRDITVESSLVILKIKNRLLFVINITNLFNFNKLLADLDIETKTPDS